MQRGTEGGGKVELRGVIEDAQADADAGVALVRDSVRVRGSG